MKTMFPILVDGVTIPDPVAASLASLGESMAVNDLPKVVSRCPNNVVRVKFAHFSRAHGKSLFYPQVMRTIGSYHPYYGGLICFDCSQRHDDAIGHRVSLGRSCRRSPPRGGPDGLRGQDVRK